MRWDRFFEDLEGQLDSEWEAERAALDTEAERLRVARVTLRERLVAVTAEAAVSIDLWDATVLVGRVAGVGADWVAVDVASRRSGAVIVPLSAVSMITAAGADLVRSARDATAGSPLAQRMGFGFVLRDLARRRVPVTVQLSGPAGGRALSGTIDRAGADHLDLAVHDAGAPRRAADVHGYRVIPFAGVSFVRLDAVAPLP